MSPFQPATRLPITVVRYALVGILGTAIHFGVLAALVEWFSFDPVLASGIGFVVTLIVSYGLNFAWTFSSTARHRTALPRYVVVSVFGLGLNTLVMHLAVRVFGLWYIAGQALVVLLVPATNFVLNRSWAFRSSSAA